MKKCSSCQIEKELNQFYKNKSKKDGLSSECKICMKKASIEHYVVNIKQERKRSKRNRKINPQYYKLKLIEWRINNPDQVKNWNQQYSKNRWQNDMMFKLRKTLSKLINQGLKSNNSCKMETLVLNI